MLRLDNRGLLGRATHGLLVVSTRRWDACYGSRSGGGRAVGVVQVAATIALMMAAWVFFRETDADFLLRHLRLSPGDCTPDEREIGIFLCAVSATRALPLVVDDCGHSRASAGCVSWNGFNGKSATTRYSGDRWLGRVHSSP